jgi:maleate isomerase
MPAETGWKVAERLCPLLLHGALRWCCLALPEGFWQPRLSAAMPGLGRSKAGFYCVLSFIRLHTIVTHNVGTIIALWGPSFSFFRLPRRPHMKQRTLLGMLTPSSNTTLEPVTAAMLAGVPEASAHFGRFRVTEIALSDSALAQFDDSEILTAAELLADARLDVIGWNGTSSGWLGFDADERLCKRITERTGIASCTSVLALNEIFERTGVRRFGLVTPYRDDVQERVIATYAKAGFECVGEQHLKLQDNFSFSEVGAEQIRAMVREVAATKPDAITIFCTNLAGAPLAAELEAETGIPIYDTISTVVWKSLRLAGVDTTRIKGWGRLFQDLT